MGTYDDDLRKFEAEGAAALPVANLQGYVVNDGARIWYSTCGSGAPVVLLHGGFGHSGNWGYQVPALVTNGYRAVLLDSRGHGRTTRDSRPFTYELMASDVLAVLDSLEIERVGLVGWSDGACTSLILAAKVPARVAGYALLSATPDQFNEFFEAVSLMQRTQPNYSVHDLNQITVPVVIAQSEHDEFIKPEHAEHLARSIPNAELVVLPGVSHFAPLQRPELFNSAMLTFLAKILPLEQAGPPF